MPSHCWAPLPTIFDFTQLIADPATSVTFESIPDAHPDRPDTADETGEDMIWPQGPMSAAFLVRAKKPLILSRMGDRRSAMPPPPATPPAGMIEPPRRPSV